MRNSERNAVPVISGVYDAYLDGHLSTQVQLDDRGNWWPHPYHFSGWRVGELEMFKLELRPDLTVDVPEIYNPELRESIRWYTEQIQALPGVDQKAAADLAYKFAIRDFD